MEAYMVLFGGATLSALIGLLGIALTKRENTPIVGLLSAEELKSYRIQRLVSEGIAFCTLGKHDFRPLPDGSTTACPVCLPPLSVPIYAQVAREERASRLNSGKGYRPLFMDFPGFGLYDDENE